MCSAPTSFGAGARRKRHYGLGKVEREVDGRHTALRLRSGSPPFTGFLNCQTVSQRVVVLT